MQSTTETPCEMTVATTAAPCTPMPILAMNRRSSTTFRPRGDEQEHQRHHAVANGAQQARAEVIGEHDQHAQVDGQNVAVRIVQDLRRGVQHKEQRVQAQHTCQRNAKGSHQTDDQ